MRHHRSGYPGFLMRIVIAGCGYVGSRLAVDLVEKGHEVWGLKRRPRGLPVGVRPLAVDLGDVSELVARLPVDLDAVVFAAGSDRFDEAAYRAVYVDGTHHLVAAMAAQESAAPRLVWTSSTSVYGDVGGGWVDEMTEPQPASWSGRVLLEAEEVARSAPGPTIVVRLGGLYGPGRELYLEALRNGRATCVDDPPQWVNLIHGDDAAGALAHVLELDHPDPLYLAVDDRPTSRCELLRWLAAEIGVPPPQQVSAADGPRRRGSKRCSNRRLRATGWRLRHPTTEDGFKALLAGDVRA